MSTIDMHCILATRQVTALATLFDCLRHVTCEVTLRLSADGIRIAQLEGNNSLYIYIHLLPDRFERYEMGAPAFEVTLLPNTMHLVVNTILRKVRTDNACLLQMHFAAPSQLRAQTSVHGTVGIELKSVAMACDEEEDMAMMGYELPCRYTQAQDHGQIPLERNGNYDSVMYMSQRHLAHLVSHVFPLGEVVELSCNRNYATFSVTNRHALIGKARVRFKLDAPTGNNNDDDELMTLGPLDRCHYFQQPLLSMLLRALSLYSTTAMMLPVEANHPVLMEANLGDLGKMTVAIAQAAEATC